MTYTDTNSKLIEYVNRAATLEVKLTAHYINLKATLNSFGEDADDNTFNAFLDDLDALRDTLIELSLTPPNAVHYPERRKS